MGAMDATVRGKLFSSRVYPEFFKIDAGDIVLYAGCGEGAQLLAYGTMGKRVVCVDIQERRVKNTLQLAGEHGSKSIEGIVADLESMPFSGETFDKIIAVDVAQHVRSPQKLFSELARVLKRGGELLITFPALQHYVLTALSRWKNKGRHSLHASTAISAQEWNPDRFNHNLSLSQWLRIGKASGLKLVRSHATTLFPPLHRYGIPRFWFSNEVIHRIDWFFGGLPGLQRCGQAMMAVYKKVP